MLPLKQSEMLPRSSLTTTTTASVSSEMPIAARCRVPSDRSSFALAESGRSTPDCQILPSRTITAPSWSGLSALGTKSA